MSVRAAAPIRQGAPDGAPKMATFKSLASVLEAGFRNLSLQNGAHTEGEKRDREEEGLVPLISNIEVGDMKDGGLYVTQSIHFSVHRSGTGPGVFPGFPVDGPHTAIDVDGFGSTVLIRSGKLTGFFYKGIGNDRIVVDFSTGMKFTDRITTIGNGNLARAIPQEVSKKALRAVAVWITSNGREAEYGEEEVASDEDQFFSLTDTALVDRHFMDIVYGVYRTLLNDKDHKGRKNRMMLQGLEWPGLRWSSLGEGAGDDESYESDESGSDDGDEILPPPSKKPNSYQ